MSLWTPSGEHPIREEGRGQGPGTPGPGGGTPGPGGGTPGPGGGTPGPGGGTPGPGGGAEAELEAEAGVDALRRQLADAPADVVVANHCYGLFELAAVYLSQSPPRLDGARLSIDALGYLVDGLGARLGEAHPSLRDALAQLRLAYVQISSASQEAGNGMASGQAGTAGEASPAGS